ncbi:carboxylesterase family protein [Aspergillus novofumigatus IBT 16806]|uniref:Carboxylesterase family protein n=1 Tax=Aspergillus novofumigatus (strain IBT 16806) TaxID=1392255 RepID=A0A2I1BV22_ASPN1|nr:carboxylesterase family protein [Aspergillus novofumigatus IBT 16806]PKX89151.1 carboxylesterase family protein [Aspergillus novofumigatus IBT 16806]
MWISCSFLTIIVLAIVSELASSANIGSTLERSHKLPLLKLPYGTWRAHQYNAEADVYVFRNIRYAAPPLGELRWSKPATPEFIPGIQDGSYGHNCIPAPIPDQFFMPGVKNLTKNSAEDCLFLDVYVPGKVVRKRQRLIPVVVWIHGGAYVSGSKDQAIGTGYYDGTSLIQQADNNLIVVTINYRLGAFGFLAGEPLRTQGVFNAGLHDQRAALAWVQAYIHLLGGDPDSVSAWGESAGGGSLMYHLIAEGGKLDPLFRRALLQSPSFAVNANPQVNHKLFRDFAAAAQCPTEGEDALRCLRLANSTILTRANEEVYLGAPVPDGKYIRNPALFEYARGNTWKKIESVIVSHVIDEASLGLPDPIPEGQVEAFISNNLPPNATEQTKTIASLFESLYANSTQKEMLSALYNDILYTCNLRAVLKAYPSPAWAFQFSFLDGMINGKHASDIPATWYNTKLQGSIEPLFGQFQRYITNHARTGNPNTPHSKKHELEYWPEVTGLEEDMPGNVFNMSNWGFDIIRDNQMPKSVCDAWNEALVEAVELNR